MAEPRRVSASPGIRRPVAFSIWSIGESGRGAGRPTLAGTVGLIVTLLLPLLLPPPPSVTVPDAIADSRMPNSPDTMPHPALTILPGDAISAPPIVASGSCFNMSLETGPAALDEESMDCATISAYVLVARTPNTARPLTWSSVRAPPKRLGEVLPNGLAAPPALRTACAAAATSPQPLISCGPLSRETSAGKWPVSDKDDLAAAGTRGGGT